MDHVLHLRCLICGAEHRPDTVAYVCPAHGVDGVLDVGYDYGLIGTSTSPRKLPETGSRASGCRTPGSVEIIATAFNEPLRACNFAGGAKLPPGPLDGAPSPPLEEGEEPHAVRRIKRVIPTKE